jgi:hypothetical protein
MSSAFLVYPINFPMKLHRFVLPAALLASPAFAQTNTFPSSGWVGVGTTNPSAKLHVQDGDIALSWNNGIFIPGYNRTELLRVAYDNVNGWEDFVKFNVPGNSGSAGVEMRMASGGGGKFIFSNGSVGIGTTSPGGKLQINSMDVGSVKTYSTANGFGLILDQYYSAASEVGASYTRTADIVASTGDISSAQIRFLTKPANANPQVALLIGSSGNVGIGTTTPSSKLEIAGSVRSTGFEYDSSDGSPWWLNGLGNGPAILLQKHIGAGSTTDRRGSLGWMDNNGTKSELLTWSQDNVGIGTTNPQHKLAVNGTIKAKEVIVETTGWSDYVFADHYRLAPLSEVEAHIAEKKHLPGMPSAAEVTENGINLAQVQAALLAKVEELTLHLIAQEKSLRELQAENETLKTRMATYEQR